MVPNAARATASEVQRRARPPHSTCRASTPASACQPQDRSSTTALRNPASAPNPTGTSHTHAAVRQASMAPAPYSSPTMV